MIQNVNLGISYYFHQSPTIQVLFTLPAIYDLGILALFSHFVMTLLLKREADVTFKCVQNIVQIGSFYLTHYT